MWRDMQDSPAVWKYGGPQCRGRAQLDAKYRTVGEKPNPSRGTAQHIISLEVRVATFDAGTSEYLPQDLSQELGCPSCQTSWMLDRWAVERERVMTVQCTVQPFDSGSIKYCAVDTPGHTDYSKNMLSVTALADVALLMVPASVGEFEAEQQSGRVREIALCCFTLGIKHIVGVVTKMDDESVEYSQSRYEEIKKVMNAHLKEVGLDAAKIFALGMGLPSRMRGSSHFDTASSSFEHSTCVFVYDS